MSTTEIAWERDTGVVSMNGRQRRLVELIRSRFLVSRHGEAHAGSYEFKRFEVAAWAGKRIALAIESGRKGDEDTMAAVFCRTHFLVVIGPRGAVSVQDFERRSLRMHRRALWMVVG